MKNIKLFWFKHPKGKGNFGDELNPYIISKISGDNINYINLQFLNENKWLCSKVLLKALWRNSLSFLDFVMYFWYNFVKKPKVLLAIGSVLQYNKYGNCVVWGSGIIAEKYHFNDAVFLAVRGKYTQQKLSNLGYNVPNVIGDPALLLPLIYKSKINRKYKIGIIPHYVHYQDIKNNASDEFLVINLLDGIEEIIDQICSCDLTLSTSLHGIIVSHVYRVPSIWINFAEVSEKLYGDDIKFKDYFSSVDLQEYDAFVVEKIKNINSVSINDFINNNFKDSILPKEDIITKCQLDLLKVAPFDLKDEYKNMS